MRRFLCRVLAPLLIVLTVADSADAWYWGKWGVLPVGYHYRVSYWQGYAVPPSYPVYVYAPGPCVPLMPPAPATPRAVWALPYAAPPSTTTAEPPMQSPAKKAPTVSESRSQGGSYTSTAPVADDICRVGFWNVAGKDLTLHLEGHVYVVPRDRAVTFEVPRRFVWQIEQHQAQTVHVPEGAKTHEVVLRQ